MSRPVASAICPAGKSVSDWLAGRRTSASAGECPAAMASNKTGNKEVKKRRIFDMDFKCQAGYRLPLQLQKGMELWLFLIS
jgi:hypothetical protein